MALSDGKMQYLQELVKKRSQDTAGKVFFSRKDKNFYQMVNSTNGVTQAIAVVPVANAKGDHPNYQNTAIVVAGTQVYGREGFRSTALKSTYNAVNASGVIRYFERNIYLY